MDTRDEHDEDEIIEIEENSDYGTPRGWQPNESTINAIEDNAIEITLSDGSKLALDSSKLEPLGEHPFGDSSTWETWKGSPHDKWEAEFEHEKAVRAHEARIAAERISIPDPQALSEVAKSLIDASLTAKDQIEADKPSTFEEKYREYMRLKGEDTPYTVKYPEDETEEL